MLIGTFGRNTLINVEYRSNVTVEDPSAVRPRSDLIAPSVLFAAGLGFRAIPPEADTASVLYGSVLPVRSEWREGPSARLFRHGYPSSSA